MEILWKGTVSAKFRVILPCLFTKFPHQEIRWNYGILTIILRSVWEYCLFTVVSIQYSFTRYRFFQLLVFVSPEAATGGVIKKLLLKISQHSQENTCVKVAGLKACNFIRKWLQHSFFPANITKVLITAILKNIREYLAQVSLVFVILT